MYALLSGLLCCLGRESVKKNANVKNTNALASLSARKQSDVGVSNPMSTLAIVETPTLAVESL